MISLRQSAEDETVVSRQHKGVNYVVNTLPGEQFRISLGAIELGSHWVPRAKCFYFPPILFPSFFFSSLEEILAPRSTVLSPEDT